MKLIVGTRGSLLSLRQTDIVIERLRLVFPDIEVEKRIIKTRGDIVKEKPLYLMRGKGFFEKEIDKAVIAGEVDFAVHSMKDVPTIRPPKTVIVAVPPRGSPYDVLVSKKGDGLMDLLRGSVVGTSSLRRRAQILRLRRDLDVKPIRGNLETRVRKLSEGLFDAVVLAEVGLQRIGMEDCITKRLPLEEFTPAPGQGALAVVTREDDKELIDILRKINYPFAEAEVLAERALVRRVRAGCKAPLGAVARASEKRLRLYAAILSPNGREKIDVDVVGTIEKPKELGTGAADKMLEAGANRLLRRWRLGIGR